MPPFFYKKLDFKTIVYLENSVSGYSNWLPNASKTLLTIEKANL